ncbi:hypothetical protein M409DRAFT_52860 [Zasmidium cellare ATCC 36951]|uniref:Uncharacterized protein n=1 Tax=Zasmidium cellare ATCC 36951 TaxID=1080233 RepID=A0A6A6CRU1_ZASCE|nr:uncharacterized protein M409DRAFT_52860 [Zasmidium cellare ATCC 36951]KAF2168860.1 hypothetical protein M409DRAFT_52860 [Zasmidium cellare ATCC 36951]
MPKGLNLKNFGRRKSSANALDFEQEAPPASTQSSFRVLERSDKKSVTYGSRDSTVTRPFASPLNALRGKSADDLGLGPNRSVDSSRSRPGWPLSGARGSGGTTNSGSSGYYESSSASARHSSTSTLPSSLDQDHNEEDLFPVKRVQTMGMYQTVTANADEPPPPRSFTTRAARALSFGNKNAKASKDLPQDIPPVPPPHVANGAPLNSARSQSPYRERAMTTSSYASTAVPVKTELTLDGDFGRDDDFSNMFESLKRDHPLPPPPTAGSFHRTVRGTNDSSFLHADSLQESEPMFPPRTLSRNALSSSPKPLKLSREDTESPYSWDARSSNDALVSNSALSSPNTLDGSAPGPAVGNGITQAFLGNSKSGYSRVPERYNSPGPQRTASVDSYSSVMDDGKEKESEYPNRQAHVDDDDRWVRRVELRDPQGSNTVASPESSKATLSTQSTITRPALNTTQATPSGSRPAAVSPNSSTGDSWAAESNTTTPRAGRVDLKGKGRADNSMFDSSPVGPPSRAVRPPAHERTESGTLKKMTKAQFQALQRHEQSSAEQSEEEDLSGDDYDDDDDIQRAKNMAKQRQKQEANMSVYRQQMKKVTGGGPTDLPSSSASTVRPSMERGSSAPPAAGGVGLHFGGIGGTPPTETLKGKDDDGDDDDVPLGILQAHGFPSGSRPPTRQDGLDMSHQRRTSMAGSVVNGGAGQGNLPPFARRLPADPYFGAGLVNQSTRESLAMNSSGASVVGMPTGPMPPQMQQQSPGHPGGLVGIIAGEERAKAARRGSPNPVSGMYNPMGSSPLPSNMGMPRTMSMGNLPPPSMYGAPPVPSMPQMPGMGMGMGMGMGQMGMMPQMPAMDPGQQQMQQFMQMQMQLMQNMLSMQQAQMGQGPQTPQPQMQQPQQQAGDYLGVNFNNMQRPMSIASQQSQLQPQPPNQGRAMTMMNPPPGWNQASQPGAPRPNSAMPLSNGSYAPSVNGLNISGGGPGAGYTPSIAPSERSNIGMPSRYRPVTQNGETSRSQSMTSSLTLQAFQNQPASFQKQQTSPNLPGTPWNAKEVQTPKSTIRIVDKPKGAPKVASRPVDEDEDEGWAEMRKKREDKKKSKWGSKSKTASQSQQEPTLSDLYQGLE